MGQHYDDHTNLLQFFFLTSMTLYSEIFRSLRSINLQKKLQNVISITKFKLLNED